MTSKNAGRRYREFESLSLKRINYNLAQFGIEHHRAICLAVSDGELQARSALCIMSTKRLAGRHDVAASLKNEIQSLSRYTRGSADLGRERSIL